MCWLSKITQVVSGRTGIWAQALSWVSSVCSGGSSLPFYPLLCSLWNQTQEFHQCACLPLASYQVLPMGGSGSLLTGDGRGRAVRSGNLSHSAALLISLSHLLPQISLLLPFCPRAGKVPCCCWPLSSSPLVGFPKAALTCVDRDYSEFSSVTLISVRPVLCCRPTNPSLILQPRFFLSGGHL